MVHIYFVDWISSSHFQLRTVACRLPTVVVKLDLNAIEIIRKYNFAKWRCSRLLDVSMRFDDDLLASTALVVVGRGAYRVAMEGRPELISWPSTIRERTGKLSRCRFVASFAQLSFIVSFMLIQITLI